MTDRTPISENNFDESGHPPIEWAAVKAALEAPTGPERTIYLGTVRPDGRPHVAGIGISVFDGEIWFSTAPDTVKAANLAANPHCVIAGEIGDFDLSVEGVAEHIVNPATLETLAARFREIGWPAVVNGTVLEAPINELTTVSRRWNLYRFRVAKVIAVGVGQSTSWTFAG